MNGERTVAVPFSTDCSLSFASDSDAENFATTVSRGVENTSGIGSGELSVSGVSVETPDRVSGKNFSDIESTEELGFRLSGETLWLAAVSSPGVETAAESDWNGSVGGSSDISDAVVASVALVGGSFVGASDVVREGNGGAFAFASVIVLLTWECAFVAGCPSDVERAGMIGALASGASEVDRLGNGGLFEVAESALLLLVVGVAALVWLTVFGPDGDPSGELADLMRGCAERMRALLERRVSVRDRKSVV